MKIVKAAPADISRLAALWHTGWHQGHGAIAPPALVATRTLEEFTDRTRSHLAQTWIAWQDGTMAGFFMITGDELYQFYVDAAFQGRGLATALMDAAEAALPRGPVWLACSVGNDRAARFYEKCGWRRAGIERYEVETRAGTQQVRVWRYEKTLT